VVLLKHPSTSKGLSAKVEPVLTTVARDAALWDLNEVLKHHMQLRRGRDATPTSSSATKSRPAVKPLALHGFQEMLQELKAGTLEAPRGVGMARLKKEVVQLVASTKEIQDEDVLRHSKIESLLQQRLQEKRLDALLALQAVWRRRGKLDAEACAAPREDFSLPVKGCPEDSEQGHSCLDGNAQIATFQEAWEKCSIVAGCGAIVRDPDDNYVLRRSSDPDLQGSEWDGWGTMLFTGCQGTSTTRGVENSEPRRSSYSQTVRPKPAPAPKPGTKRKTSAAAMSAQNKDKPRENALVGDLVKRLAAISAKHGASKGEQEESLGEAIAGEWSKLGLFHKFTDEQPKKDDDNEEGADVADDASDLEGEEEWADAASQAVQKASQLLERKSEEMKKNQKNLLNGAGNGVFEMSLEKGTVEFKMVEGENMLRQIAKQLGQAVKAQDGQLEDSSSDSEEPHVQVEFDQSSSSIEQEDLLARMTELVGGENLEEGNAEGVREVTKVLHENIQSAFRSHFQKHMGAMQGQDDDAEGGAKKDMKVKVHVLNMQDGEIDATNNGALAQMLQNMLSDQQAAGQATDGTVEITTTTGDEVNMGAGAGNLAEALQSMFSQAQRRKAEEEDSTDDP
jgi:hypothetical protein